MSGLSTHVLDTASGKPAAGIGVTLVRQEQELYSASTNSDGRIASLLPASSKLEAGIYRLIFDVESYFPQGFYPKVIVEFVVRDAETHYHVPVLISPFGYSTYRGS